MNNDLIHPKKCVPEIFNIKFYGHSLTKSETAQIL